MGKALNKGDLIRPLLNAFGRQIRLLIPLEDSRRLFQQTTFLVHGMKLLQRCFRFHAFIFTKLTAKPQGITLYSWTT
jgi:hypothetical protein